MEEEVVAEEVACKEDQGGVDMLQQFVGTTRAGDRKGRGVCLAVNTNKDKTNGKAS